MLDFGGLVGLYSRINVKDGLADGIGWVCRFMQIGGVLGHGELLEELPAGKRLLKIERPKFFLFKTYRIIVVKLAKSIDTEGHRFKSFPETQRVLKPDDFCVLLVK
jgi:hypothetical protein